MNYIVLFFCWLFAFAKNLFRSLTAILARVLSRFKKFLTHIFEHIHIIFEHVLIMELVSFMLKLKELSIFIFPEKEINENRNSRNSESSSDPELDAENSSSSENSDSKADKNSLSESDKFSPEEEYSEFDYLSESDEAWYEEEFGNENSDESYDPDLLDDDSEYDYELNREFQYYYNSCLKSCCIKLCWHINNHIEYYGQNEEYYKERNLVPGYNLLILLEKINTELTYFKPSVVDPYRYGEFDPLYFLEPFDYKWFEMRYFKWSMDDPYPLEELDPSYSVPVSESEWEERRDSQINQLPLSSRCELVYYWIRGFIFSTKISKDPNIYLSGPKVMKFLRKISDVLDTI